MTLHTMHIGFDDTDSTRKGCTTYIVALLVEKLERLGVKFVDYPNLIRLNPNVPWKTRGNGALCLRLQFNSNFEEKIKETVLETVEENSDLAAEGTEPGIVFFKSATIPRELKMFAKKTITDIVTFQEALKLLRKFKAEAFGFKSGQGIIGALAAVGENLNADHTYELIAYRAQENWGSTRRVDDTSVFSMDKATAPYTFNNMDAEKRRIVITPRGPDPILFGIRGESPEIVKKAFGMVKPLEPVDRWVVFRTNHGTDAHLVRIRSLSEARPYMSIIAKGVVSVNPRIVPLRHVVFSVEDGSGEIDCAAYEPTGELRRKARELIVGDKVEIYGAVRSFGKGRPLTVNLEKIRVLHLAPKFAYSNPFCDKCGKRLKSMGAGKGFRCERCGLRYETKAKLKVKAERAIQKGLHVTSTRSQRHLTKPLRRYGLEKRHAKVNLVDCWHSP
ncbi:MAG: tRNA(Ile)(2)-agmatinylcytidine synthase [Candidatus Bathyarchaeia archaeon]